MAKSLQENQQADSRILYICGSANLKYVLLHGLGPLK